MAEDRRRGEETRENHAERGLIAAARLEAAAMSRGVGAFQRDHPHLRPPPADHFPGYELIREIHRGGQGVVYHAIQVSTRRDVAIKVVRNSALAGPRERARFDLEMQILGQFDHPNIVTIHDSGTIGDCSYGVMDYIVGLPLDEYMALETRAVKRTLALFAKICDAVNVAHLRGVIHRDLKPGNIRVDHSGEPHILDFGLAKVSEFDVLAQTQARTVEGQFVGSLPWASPEQAEGSADLDIRTDVYSLGVILYQMLTGRFPYQVTGPIREVVEHITTSEPVSPRSIRRDISDEVETIALKCLSKDRERRYQGAGELARDVRRCLSGEPIEAKRDSGWYVLRKGIARHKGSVGIAAGFVSFAAVAAVAFAVLYNDAERERAAAFEYAEASSAVMGALMGVIEFGDPARLSGVDLDSLDYASEVIGERFRDRPAQEGYVRYALSVGYWYAAHVDLERAMAGATREAQRAWEIQREVRGTTDPDTLASRFMLAAIAAGRGEFVEAERIAREVIALAQEPTQHPDPFDIAAMSGLGVLLQWAGQFDRAEVEHRRGVGMAVERYGPFDPRTMDVKGHLLVSLCGAGRCAEAQALALAWNEEAERAEGASLTARVQTLYQVNRAFRLAGDAATAEKYVEEARQLQQRRLGSPASP